MGVVPVVLSRRRQATLPPHLAHTDMNPPVASPPNVLEQLVKRSRRLYSLPAVAMQVVELTNEPSVDVAALKACLQNDPALTSKILRVVNSSLFGLPTKVSDLSQALALIGVKPLKLLVLGFSLPDELLSNLETHVLQRYWRHALVKAVAAREISELVWDMSGDEAFIAGLLQDIGALVLIQDLGQPYVTFLDQVWSAGGDLAELESATLGFDHGVLSARLLEAWRLPSNLIHAVGQPFDVARLSQLPPAERDLPQILHLAEIVAEFLANDRAELLNGLLEVGQQYHDLTIGQVEALIASLEINVQPLAQIFSISLEPSDYRNILARAHGQLASAADQANEFLESSANPSALEHVTSALSGAVEGLTSGTKRTPIPSPHVNSAQQANNAARGGRRRGAVERETTNDPGMLGHVAAAISRCRKSRREISLALVELDDFETLFLTHGVEGTYQVAERLRSILVRLLDGEGRLLEIGDARFAVIMEDFDRQQAVSLVRHVVAGIRRASVENATHDEAIRSISVGLATLAMPPKNFPTHELIDAAQRCLDGVKLSGGDSVKSLDIY